MQAPPGGPPPPPPWFSAAARSGPYAPPPRAYGPPPPRAYRPLPRAYATPRFVDPDSVWVQQFEARQVRTPPAPPTTVQAVREKLAWGLQTVRECKLLQHDLAHLAATWPHDDERAMTRTKLQWDRRCATLNSHMEKLRAFQTSFFDDSDAHATLRRLVQRVAKKTRYRKALRQRRKAEAIIAKGLQLAQVDDLASTTESTMATTPAMTNEDPVPQPSNRQQMKREALSKRLRLLLELKKQRSVQLTADDIAAQTEASAVLAARDALMAARKRPPPPPLALDEQQSPVAPKKMAFPLREAKMTMESLVAVRFAWDAFLVYDGTGTRIPPCMVDPPAEPSEGWQPYYHQESTATSL
ncbi:hypothetical protein SPRG_00234 [Saprolegnia parasitica CBS 223.65]|uniref:Uncharacterized protein n=1 Tax=Saprolegnia parasitica (strain CBS 223.65) TaxID=695850 RepID=A0A067D1K7_SAPPC|nr:hypothetical protein SPRG_00234 [Saprolegnia parasitica CBS 223.65]KDO35385.1 hypothetical protein SPRG_00234 [Saprolegnia parasitica CBS 223.65]|eukprot:XP_012193729.1 hypothetical protein SPRG_00234 [Saprolegnia parasitica CBS 223.65]